MDFPIVDLLDPTACYQFLVGNLHPQGLRCPTRQRDDALTSIGVYTPKPGLHELGGRPRVGADCGKRRAERRRAAHNGGTPAGSVPDPRVRPT
jgi:hypothetical protein